MVCVTTLPIVKSWPRPFSR